MKIRWHGNACFEVSNSQYRIVIDPHDGKSIGIKPPILNADIVLVTHDHFDNNAIRAVRGNFATVFAETGITEIKGMKVEGFHTFHDEVGGNIRGENVIYRFEMDGISVCHCGGLGDMPSDEVVEALKGVDIIFIPTGETFTISMEKLEMFLERIDPKVMVPMGYKVGSITIPLRTLDEFLEDVSDDMILYVGNEVELSGEDLSEFLGLWVFDY